MSHDEKLLKSAVTSIGTMMTLSTTMPYFAVLAEVRAGTLELYKSRSHDQWLEEREERLQAAVAAYEAQQREIARLQGFVDRFGET